LGKTVGLRYELVTPQWESNNHLANFDPITNSLIQASSGSIYNRALVNMPKLDFAPRFGLAFQADPKTVIRAGYGLGFAQFNREGGENMLGHNGPFIVNTNRVQGWTLRSLRRNSQQASCLHNRRSAFLDLLPHHPAGLPHGLRHTGQLQHPHGRSPLSAERPAHRLRPELPPHRSAPAQQKHDLRGLVRR
jgi:hypothetical protein